MSMINVKGLKNSDGVVFKPVPAGRYKVRCTKVDSKTTSPTSKKYQNHPYKSFCFMVTEGQDQENRKVFDIIMDSHDDEGNLIVSQEDAERTAAQYMNLMTAMDMEIPDDEAFDTQDFVGRECLAVVSISGTGKDARNNITDYLPLSEVE
jgi:hypothetical protein